MKLIVDIPKERYEWIKEHKGVTDYQTTEMLYKRVRESEKQRTGHWIEVTNGRGGHECNLCHEYAPSYQDGDEWLTKHCPNCGAAMTESEE